jgi:hypothetical protein
VERVSGSGALGEAEVRSCISLQIVIDAARAAELEVASPIAAGSHAVLLVYGGTVSAESALRARRVQVRAFDSDLEDVALAIPMAPGELLALVEWGGFGEGDAVFLLAAKDIEGMQNGCMPLRDCVALPGRWRALVLG